MIKVISVIQPWASLIALGEKKIETRSWATKYRGELYIHASKKPFNKISYEEPFYSALKPYHKEPLPENNKRLHVGLTGVIIAKCYLYDCVKIVEEFKNFKTAYIESELADRDFDMVNGNEFCFGDYTPGRFAWILQDVKMLEKPIPAKGQLNIWNFDLSEGM